MNFGKTFLSDAIKDDLSSFNSLSSNIARQALKFAQLKALSRYGYSIEIKDQNKIELMNGLIKKIDKNFNKRNVSDDGLLCDTFVVYVVDENTILSVVAGEPLSTNSLKIFMNERISNGYNKMKVNIYGKYAHKWFNKINDTINVDIHKGNLRIFNISSNADDESKESFQSIISDMKPRDIDTLFYDYGIKESVINHIDGFFNSKKLYEDKNINYKTSLLLYGPPGTGKSSLANALCAKYNLDMVLVDMNTFDKLDVNILTQCINGDDNTYLILLEDIDTIFNINRESETVEKDDKKVINKLLQFLDSNSSPNNVIFVATTNHIDKLDEAILRRGRIDKNIYIGPINQDIAREMCESFDLSEVGVDEIINSHKDEELINQSTLQSEILDCIKVETAKAAGILDIDKAVKDANIKSAETEEKEEREEDINE